MASNKAAGQCNVLFTHCSWFILGLVTPLLWLSLWRNHCFALCCALTALSWLTLKYLEIKELGVEILSNPTHRFLNFYYNQSYHVYGLLFCQIHKHILIKSIKPALDWKEDQISQQISHRNCPIGNLLFSPQKIFFNGWLTCTNSTDNGESKWLG